MRTEQPSPVDGRLAHHSIPSLVIEKALAGPPTTPRACPALWSGHADAPAARALDGNVVHGNVTFGRSRGGEQAGRRSGDPAAPRSRGGGAVPLRPVARGRRAAP